MTDTKHLPMKDISKALDAKLHQGLVLKPSSIEEFKHFEKIAVELAAKAYMGRVAYAGQSSSGTYSVQFNVENGSGYASSWPQWAFELAKAAVLDNKRVWVIANGEPFGANLIQVMIFMS